jgi:hypothetical protein
MRRPLNWLVVWSSALLLLTAMKLPGGSGSGTSDTLDHPPMVASEQLLTFAYLPRETSARAVIPALLTTSDSEMSSIESAPLLQFELLANPDL